MSDRPRPYELEILSEEEIGRKGGFLYLRRLHLRNLRPDGSRSREWLCDFVERPKGVDAVVLLLWRQGESAKHQKNSETDTIEVLLRAGLRPAVIYGRAPGRLPIADARAYFLFEELVAGIIEEGEVGEAAVRRRAVDEAWEEAGARIAPDDVELLGPGVFPSPGMTGEKFWLAAARVAGAAQLSPPEGDGSPMEEGATVRWVPLEEALSMCDRGELEDAKTELALRRLERRLRQRAGAVR